MVGGAFDRGFVASGGTLCVPTLNGGRFIGCEARLTGGGAE